MFVLINLNISTIPIVLYFCAYQLFPGITDWCETRSDYDRCWLRFELADEWSDGHVLGSTEITGGANVIVFNFFFNQTTQLVTKYRFPYDNPTHPNTPSDFWSIPIKIRSTIRWCSSSSLGSPNVFSTNINEDLFFDSYPNSFHWNLYSFQLRN